jgi:hypothetical protein
MDEFSPARPRGVRTPPGRIRPRSAASQRVRPVSAGFQNIGFFSTHTPGHLTSPSRRPVSPAVQHGYAIAPYGTDLEHVKDACERADPLDVGLRAEQQTKAVYSAVTSLSSRSKSDLRELLAQGLMLLGALPESLAVEVCAAASENEDHNLIASMMCSEFKSKQLEGKLDLLRAQKKMEEDKLVFYASLNQLIAHGVKLLEQVDSTMVRCLSRCLSVRLFS